MAEGGRLIHRESGRVLATRATLAQGFWERGRGWIGKQTVTGAEALCITECNQIHTFGVRFPIEVAFCDADGRVLQVATLSPCRLSSRIVGATCVWEAAVGTLLPYVSRNDTLCWEEA